MRLDRRQKVSTSQQIENNVVEHVQALLFEIIIGKVIFWEDKKNVQFKYTVATYAVPDLR